MFGYTRELPIFPHGGIYLIRVVFKSQLIQSRNHTAMTFKI
jgi:hypothetical protein